MNQGIAGIGLRAVVAGACYAVERFAMSGSASDGDSSVTLPKRAAAELDATLASPRIEHGSARAPALRMPPGAVVRQSLMAAKPLFPA